MTKKKQQIVIKHKVTVTVYEPIPGVQETLRPQFTFEGEPMSMKMTEAIFFYLRKALRMDKLKLAKKEKEENGRDESGNE